MRLGSLTNPVVEPLFFLRSGVPQFVEKGTVPPKVKAQSAASLMSRTWVGAGPGDGADALGSGPVTVISPQGVEGKKDFKDLY